MILDNHVPTMDLLFQNKIKSSTDRSQNMLEEFTKNDKDSALSKYPELKQYYAIRQRNYEKIESLGKRNP